MVIGDRGSTQGHRPSLEGHQETEGDCWGTHAEAVTGCDRGSCDREGG